MGFRLGAGFRHLFVAAESILRLCSSLESRSSCAEIDEKRLIFCILESERYLGHAFITKVEPLCRRDRAEEQRIPRVVRLQILGP